MIRLPRLYAVADAAFGDPVDLAAALFEGGARLVQLRNKAASSQTLLAETETILRLAPPGSRVFVNDRTDVARIAAAAGVHLGQNDLPPHLSRAILSNEQVIGYSTHDLSQALEAELAPVDYIAVGPVFATTTKADAEVPLGLEKLREICSRVSKPVVAIGGISLQSAHEVLKCGVTSLAVISDILKHEDVAERTRQWVEHLELR
jgi:thiamine-phosphate pyrophosphorylase